MPFAEKIVAPIQILYIYYVQKLYIFAPDF